MPSGSLFASSVLAEFAWKQLFQAATIAQRGQRLCEPHLKAEHMAALTKPATCRFLLPTRSRPHMCRFSDAGMTKLSPGTDGRRPKSAKARNRGRWGTDGAAGAMGILPRAR